MWYVVCGCWLKKPRASFNAWIGIYSVLLNAFLFVRNKVQITRKHFSSLDDNMLRLETELLTSFQSWVEEGSR